MALYNLFVSLLAMAPFVALATDYCTQLCSYDYSKCPKTWSECNTQGYCVSLYWKDSTKTDYCNYGTTGNPCPSTKVKMSCSDALMELNKLKSGTTTTKPSTTTTKPSTTTTKLSSSTATTTTKVSSSTSSGTTTTTKLSSTTSGTATTTKPASTTLSTTTTKPASTIGSGGSGLTFVSFADWGDPSTTLTQVATFVKSKFSGVSYLNLLGDNFYGSGVASTTDPLWKIFTDTVAVGQLVHNAVLGNHDVGGNVDAQVQMTNIDKRWYMPSRYYVKTIQGSGFTLCAVYLDTNILDSTQLSWLDATLANCQGANTWRLVHGHHPIYSIGEHGDSSSNIANLLPVLKNRKTHAYICGHDHDMQHYYDGSMHFVVTGAVAQLRTSETLKSHAYLKFFDASQAGVLYSSLGASSIAMQFFSAKTGSSLYQFSISM